MTPYNNYDEMLAKIRAPGRVVRPGLPGSERAQQDGLRRAAPAAQPLLPPDLKNVWPEYQDPWYDQGAHYTVPYTIYATGVMLPRRPGLRACRRTATTCSGTSSTPARSTCSTTGRRPSACRCCATSITDDINTSDAADVQKATDIADRADRPGERQDRRQRLLRGPRGHGHGPPGLVGRPDRRAVLPAQGRDARGAWLLAPGGPADSGSSATTTSRSRSRAKKPVLAHL